MFAALPTPPEDSLHAVMGRYNADPRAHKIDLGVGVYRDERGNSPIMRAVTDGQHLLAQSETSKGYLALRGDEQFLAGMAKLTFGGLLPDRVAALQSVGGTGGVRLAIEIAANAKPDLTVFVGTPTWPNHIGICGQLKVRCQTYCCFDVATQQLDIESTRAALASAQAGDVFVLHGPCHNPTGADLAIEIVTELVDAAAAKGVIPLIDAAYYGLGNDLDEDLAALAKLVLAAPQAALVLSCSKSFGLYRERTGVLFVACASASQAQVVQGTLEFIARGSYSMPPSHGAAVVGQILAFPALASVWRAELREMRERVQGVRQQLQNLSRGRAAQAMLAAVGQQKGIFSLLPLTPDEVTRLSQDAAIYMPQSGRINVAGFKAGDVETFVEALERL